MSIYKLVWDDFASWLLEIVKPRYQQPIDKKTYQTVISILENNIKILHPFMPFLTEEIWQFIEDRNSDKALIISNYPVKDEFNESLIEDFEKLKEIVSGIRTIRKDKNLSFKEPIELYAINNENLSVNNLPISNDLIDKIEKFDKSVRCKFEFDENVSALTKQLKIKVSLSKDSILSKN